MKNIIFQFSFILILCLLAHAQQIEIEAIQAALVKDVAEFETIKLNNRGEPVAFSVELGKSTVKLEDAEFDGFRFRCPEEIDGRDFVWYFNAPEGWGNWYIVPVEDRPGQAFKTWLDGDKLYLPFDKVTEKNRLRILQTLDQEYFTPGKEYIMWFRKTSADASSSLRGTASFAKKEKSWKHDEIEKALLLKLAPVQDQVTVLNSIGGLILLDEEFFDRSYAESRIDSAFASIRSTEQLKGGFFITIQTAVPPCVTNPSLEKIIAQHGPPDFVRTGEEQDRLRRHSGSKPLNEDEKNITYYHYDYFAFEVKTREKHPEVNRVRTYGCNFSDVRPTKTGSTFGSLGMENLTVFHRDGKEVGRAYQFLENSKQPLFITVPPKGEYQNDSETLVCEGDGKWKWETRFQDGKIARRILLENDQSNGDAEGFHENGKSSFRATYKDGRLNGELIKFDEDGKEVERRDFKEGKEVKK